MNNNLKAKNAAFVNLKENEITNAYVKEIMRYKPISAKEEKVLFEKIEFAKMAEVELNSGKLSDSDVEYYNNVIKEAASAREEIILRNQRFIYANAKRYSQDDELLPDLISEGNLGLLAALDSYDLYSGNRFCTYAVWFIRRSINAYITSGNVMIYKSNVNKVDKKLAKIQNKFFAQNGRYPTNEEVIDILSDEFGIVVKNVSDVFDMRIDSINTGYDDEDDKAFENSYEFVSHTCAMPDDVYSSDVDYNESTANRLLMCLDEREREIVTLAFGFDNGGEERTNAEVGKIVGLTSERVRQIKKLAIEKMQEHASDVSTF